MWIKITKPEDYSALKEKLYHICPRHHHRLPGTEEVEFPFFVNLQEDSCWGFFPTDKRTEIAHSKSVSEVLAIFS